MGRRLGTPWPALVLAAISVALLIASGPISNLAKSSSGVGISFVVGLIGFLIVGLILVRNRPRNPIGWSMLLAAFFGSITAVAGSYAIAAYRLKHDLPLPQIAVFLQPSWAPCIVMFAIAIMLFPDGVLPSRRWRWGMGVTLSVGMFWMLGAFAIAVETIALDQVKITPSGDLEQISDPRGGWAWWGVLQNVWFALILLVGVFWLVSRVPVYRAATGERRQQLKWLIFGGSTAVVGLVLTVVLSGSPGVLGFIGSLGGLGLIGIPLSIGVGMTRYRLYDIDRIVSRTLAYALLTALLVGTFAGIVLLTTRVLPFSSPVGVAASTLVALALVNPLRGRIQRAVDRRFNRARYDAEATVTAFGARLRDAVDPETVLRELASAAGGSLQPEHVSVWVPGESR